MYLSEVTRMVLVHVDSVVVLTSGVTATPPPRPALPLESKLDEIEQSRTLECGIELGNEQYGKHDSMYYRGEFWPSNNVKKTN